MHGFKHCKVDCRVRAPNSASRLRRAFSFTRPHRWYLFAVLILTLLVAAASSIEPLVMKHIFDQLVEGGALKAIMWGVGLLLGMGLIREGATIISNSLTWRTRLDIHYSLLDAAVERIHRLPSEYHRSEGVGAIMTRLDRSIQGVIGALSEISFNVLPAIAYLGLALVMMIRLDWRLTLLVILFAPIPALIAAFAAPRQIRRERTLFDRWARIYSRFNEVLAGIVTVRSFAMENVEKQKFLDKVSTTNQVVVRGVKFDASVGALQNIATIGARIAAIGLGSWLVLRDEITVGVVIAFLGYVSGLFGPVQGLTGIYKILRTASVSLSQLFTILDEKEHVEDAHDAEDVHALAGAVAFSHVHFSYDKKSPLLRDISFSVEPGQTMAIVGPSGSGKSTIMALLQRFYDVDAGSVTVDGRDIRRLKQDQLRRQIGVVLQDALLFNETVRDNIAYGRPDATQSDIEAAARAANAHAFICRLNKGYHTVVGERGSRLSAGERQRVALARAILKDPPILILDEATSALDAETESLVQGAIERLTRGRTTFVIAHRLSTVVNAEAIMVLKNGSIIEAGSHEALYRKSGYYASLVKRQTKGLLAA